MGAFRSLIAWALALGFCLAASAQEMRIQFAEKVQLAAAPGHVEFDAYGRRFALDLEVNHRLTRLLPVTGKNAIVPGRLFRGSLSGVTGSWVRLARIGDALSGAIWDGHELYVVTSKAQIAANLTLPLEGAPSQTVVYRLSDTVGGLPREFCGVDKGLPGSKIDDVSALKQYETVVGQLQAADFTSTEQIDVSLIADSSFQAQYGNFARDEMLARLNIVDGIFDAQVHVLIVPVEVRMIPAGSDPFTATAAETLLQQLSTYRISNDAVRSAGLAHLVTAKDLDSNTVGIAYRDVLCDQGAGVSLSDSEMGQFLSALVMAHELGHNFGAPHDGAPGACSAVTDPLLMAPAINGSAQFSQCSLQQMQQPIARARGLCIHAAQYADVAIGLPASPYNVDTSAPFSIPITVRSAGDIAATGVTLRVDLPSLFQYQSAVLNGGSCSLQNGIVTCALGDMAAGEERVVQLNLRSSGSLNTFSVPMEVDADNEFLKSNNGGTLIVGLQTTIDFAVAMTSSANPVFATDPVDFIIDVTQLRTQTVPTSTLTVFLSGLTAESVSAGGQSCTIQLPNNQLVCQLAGVGPTTPAHIVVHARASYPGLQSAIASVNVANDWNANNNTVAAGVTVRAERDLLLAVSTEDLHAIVGAPYEVTYTMTAAGRLAIANSSLTVQPPSAGTVESVTPSAGSCSAPAPRTQINCTFGTLNPGDVRTVVVRLHMDSNANDAMSGQSRNTTAGVVQQFNTTYTRILSNARFDVLARVTAPAPGVEGRVTVGYLELASVGIEGVQNVVATLDMPAPARISAVRMSYNNDGFQCAVVTPQQVRCAGSFGSSPSSGYVRVDYDLISDMAMQGTVRLSATATADGDASDDTSTAAFEVRPFVDVGLTSTERNVNLVAGTTGTLDLTLNTGRNPTPKIRIGIYGLAAALAVDAIRVDGVDCALDTSGGSGQYACDLANPRVNASLPVSIVVRALVPNVDSAANVGVFTADDADASNNSQFFAISTWDLTEVQLAVAQTTMTGINGTQIHLPLITVTNGNSIARNVVVEIPLPTFLAMNSIPTQGFICTGTDTLLQCTYSLMSPGAVGTIDVQAFASAVGTFTSDIRMQALNDTSAANNSGSVAVTVSAASTGGGSSGGGTSGGGSSSPSGGGGGGGRMEWMALAVLALLLARRLRAAWFFLS